MRAMPKTRSPARRSRGRPGRVRHAHEVNARYERVRGGRGEPSQEIVVQRVDSGEAHADQHLALGGRNGQVVHRRRFTETTNSESRILTSRYAVPEYIATGSRRPSAACWLGTRLTYRQRPSKAAPRRRPIRRGAVIADGDHILS